MILTTETRELFPHEHADFAGALECKVFRHVRLHVHVCLFFHQLVQKRFAIFAWLDFQDAALTLAVFDPQEQVVVTFF